MLVVTNFPGISFALLVDAFDTAGAGDGLGFDTAGAAGLAALPDFAGTFAAAAGFLAAGFFAAGAVVGASVVVAAAAATSSSSLAAVVVRVFFFVAVVTSRLSTGSWAGSPGRFGH